MINFDSFTLKLFAEENSDFFNGAKIQKVQQPGRNELIFHIRNKGESRKFYVNFNPNFYHLCFMSEQNEKRRNIVIPKTAPMFCMLLRKYILNSKIAGINVPEYERIFEIYFEYFDELNERSLLCLAIELMGKHSNVILYNYDTNVIIGCAHNVSSEKSRERELSGLLPYIYPPKKKKNNLLKTSFKAFCSQIDDIYDFAKIANQYYYLTIPIVRQALEQNCIKSHEVLYKTLRDYLSAEYYVPGIKKDFSEFSFFQIRDSFVFNTVNEMSDEYFSYYMSLFQIENLRTKILRSVNVQLKKYYSLKEKQLIQINKIDKAFEYKQKADILMANLYYIKGGEKSVSLFDFEGKEITIVLDENLSASENAAGYYSLYKKFKSANEHSQELLNETLLHILYYEEIKFYVENSVLLTELQEIYSELNDEKVQIKEQSEKVDFIEYKGFRIYFGKNKKQNDYILSKLSSSEDLWFHMLNAPGAHILVKRNYKDEQVPDDVLLKAAELTKQYSSQKNNSKASVIYTQRKYVKKACNKLAFVTYKNESEIVV